MSSSVKFESRKNSRKTFKPKHKLPGQFFSDYILLPYGMYYENTKIFLDAKTGDIIRFFNGPECKIESVTLVSGKRMCDILSRIRYGIPWKVAFETWRRYAMMEGHGKDILSENECIMIVFERNEQDTL